MFTNYLLVLLVFSSGKQTVDGSFDFRTVSCSQRSNVTIVTYRLELVNRAIIDSFLNYHLTDIAENHPCITINIYLHGEDRVIRWDKNTINHIERQIKILNTNHSFEIRERIVNFVQNIYNARLATQNGGSFKQTFVLMINLYWERHEKRLYDMLKKLQDDSWNVIVFCTNKKCPSEIWMPLHRLIYTNDLFMRDMKVFRDRYLTDLANL